MEAAEALGRLGLPEYQARALAYLAHNQGATAEQVAEEGEVPVTKVYSVLQALAAMGLVRSDLSRPKHYTTLEPKALVGFLVRRQEAVLDYVRGAAEAALALLSGNGLNGNGTVVTEAD